MNIIRRYNCQICLQDKRILERILKMCPKKLDTGDENKESNFRDFSDIKFSFQLKTKNV